MVYKCRYCPALFEQHEEMQVHLRQSHSHLGEHFFVCCQCGQFFNQRGDLINYKHLHKGVKLFGCSICNKPSGYLSTLKRSPTVHMHHHSQHNQAQGSTLRGKLGLSPNRMPSLPQQQPALTEDEINDEKNKAINALLRLAQSSPSPGPYSSQDDAFLRLSPNFIRSLPQQLPQFAPEDIDALLSQPSPGPSWKK